MYQVSCDLLDEQSEVRKLKLRQIKAKKVSDSSAMRREYERGYL